MDASDGCRRRSERLVPAHRVAISAETENARTSGEAVNLSAGGACLALDDGVFDVGDRLILSLQFARPKQRVAATARVVWTAFDRKPPRCGLEWTHGGPQRDWLGWLTRV